MKRLRYWSISATVADKLVHFTRYGFAIRFGRTLHIVYWSRSPWDVILPDVGPYYGL